LTSLLRKPAFNPAARLEGIGCVTQDTGVRHYTTPEGNSYPSATTILKVMDDGGIKDWVERIGEDEAKRITMDAADRGTAFHKMCEDYITLDTFDVKNYNPRYGVLFNRARVHINKFTEVLAVEYPLYSDDVGVAGSVDIVGYVNSKLTIGDFKTARYAGQFAKWGKKKIFKYLIQTGIYGLMWEERYGQTPEQCFIIMASEYDIKCRAILQPIGPFMREARRVKLAYEGKLDKKELAFFNIF